MKQAIAEVEKIKREIRNAIEKKREVELYLLKMIIDKRYTDCLTINYPILKRYLQD